MQASFEYILAGITVLMILVVAEVNMYTIVTHKLANVEEEIRLEKAKEILDILLLSPGDPPDWGDYVEDPNIMGLAVQNTIEEYVLDPKKIVRLDEDNDHYILPTTARSLMGLSKIYHFSLEIIPFFMIEIDNLGNGNFAISVTNYRGLPAPNVNVTGYYIPLPFEEGSSYDVQSKITDLNGNCTLEFSQVPNSTFIVTATQSGIKSIGAEDPNITLKVEDGYVIQSDTSIIPLINYYTGTYFTAKKETVSRYVKIEGFTYYVEFNFWS